MICSEHSKTIALKTFSFFVVARFLFGLVVYAQETPRIDSLKQLMKGGLLDTGSIQIAIELSKEYRDNDVPLAFKYAEDAYQAASAIHYQDGIANASSMLGLCYLNFGDSKKALTYNFKALDIFISLENTRKIAYTYNNIGSVFSKIKQYDKAKYFYTKSLEVKLQHGMNKEASSSYINLGNIAMYQNKLDSCIHYYKLGLSNALRYHDQQNITIGLMNLGEAYLDKKELNKAILFYTKALKRLDSIENKTSEAQAYFALGKIFDHKKQYDVAESHFQRALNLNQKNKNKQLELLIYKYMSQMFEHKGDLSKALLLNKKYTALNDSFYNEETTKNINEMHALFSLKEKEDQIKLLNKENELILINKRKSDQLRNFLTIGIILTSIIALLLFRSIMRKQKTNRLLKLKNNQIEWQRSEIERKNIILAEFNKELLKENVVARYETLKSKINPHFLFNSLSTLSALIVQQPQTALEFVSKFSKLYRSIMDHGEGHLVTIAEELQVIDSFVYLKKMRFGEAIRMSINIPPENTQHLIPPFALQLLVENAIKHNFISDAQPLHITINCVGNTVKVVNNFQPRNVPSPGSGLGQQSIIERYQFVSDIVPEFYLDSQNYIAIIPTIVSSKWT